MEALCNSLLQCLGNKYGLNHILAQQGTNIMPVPRYAWGVCNRDGRYKHKDYMKNVSFFTFPKPNLADSADPKTVQCHQWIKACDRPCDQLNIKYIAEDIAKRKYYYRICSKVIHLQLLIFLLKGNLFTFIFKTLYPRGAINWGQLWLMQWPVAWWHQAITLTHLLLKWCYYQMRMVSASLWPLALCEGNKLITGGFPS